MKSSALALPAKRPRVPWAVALPPTAFRLIGGRTGAGPLTVALGLSYPTEVVELLLRRAVQEGGP